MDSDLLNGQTLNQEAVAQLHAQLENKIQGELDQLSMLTNQYYGDGKHRYDYQLVRLSEEESKKQMEDMKKIEQIYLKHTNLQR